jgi:hypothetical protein
MLPFFVSVLSALLYIVIFVLLVAICVWVIEALLGVAIPPYIVKLGKIAVVIVCVIVLLGVFMGGLPPLWHGNYLPR